MTDDPQECADLAPPEPCCTETVGTAPSAARSAIGGPREVPLHFRGVTAEDVAAILERHGPER